MTLKTVLLYLIANVACIKQETIVANLLFKVFIQILQLLLKTNAMRTNILKDKISKINKNTNNYFNINNNNNNNNTMDSIELLELNNNKTTIMCKITIKKSMRMKNKLAFNKNKIIMIIYFNKMNSIIITFINNKMIHFLIIIELN